MRVTAFITATILGACALVPASTLAATTAYAIDQPNDPAGPNSIPLTIPVTASIGTACGSTVLPTSTYDLGDLTVPITTLQVPLPINCTAAFRIGIVSSNGGLKSATAAPNGYTNLRAYNVDVHVLEDNTSIVDPGNCLASTLQTGGSCSFLGPAGAASGGVPVPNATTSGTGSFLKVSDAPIGANQLVAGTDYQDVLTITVTPAS